MSAIELLAIIGGITGPLAAGAQVLHVWRDRPRIKVGYGYTDEVGKPPILWISVLNHGRQPVTIREAGFYGGKYPVVINSQERGKLRAEATYTWPLIRSPVLLDPGRYHQAEGTVPDAAQYGFHVDHPLRLYADNARGRRVWGEAAPIVRMMVGGGDCPAGFPAHLWNPPASDRAAPGPR